MEDQPTILDRMSQVVGVSCNLLTNLSQLGECKDNDKMKVKARALIEVTLDRMMDLAKENFDFGDRDGDV